jgi:hypothetical protein
MPVLCSAVIVVGLAVGGLLLLGESLSARRVTGTATMSLRNEIDRSDYRIFRGLFSTWYAKDMAEFDRGAPAAPSSGTGATTPRSRPG